MSAVKFSQESFLGKQELDRFKKFMDDDGFRKLFLEDATSFGLFDNESVGDFTNFKVEQGTNVGTIKHSEGVAIDSDGNLIRRAATDNIPLTDDDQWRWVKVSYAASPVEVGEVSIDVSGNLVGTGTEFTSVLRGAQNNPVKIRFNNASLNTGEYEVQAVTDDTNAVLSGVFQAESNLELVVVGAFSATSSPSAGEKDIYQYDSCTFETVLETVLETPPALTANQEFYIARVKNNGGTISINDVRSRYIYKSKANFRLEFLPSTANVLIGVDGIKYDHPYSPRDNNIMYLSWGFRTNNWGFNATNNRVSVSGGEGGLFKDSSYFTTGDFDGWRLYTEDGNHFIIKTSTKSGSSFDLDFDTLDFSSFSDTGQQLLIVPNVEEIEIHVESDNTDDQEIVEYRHVFPINQEYAKIPVLAYSPTASYKVKYSYRNNRIYSVERLIPTDAVGFYNEASYNDDGSLKDIGDRVRSPYTSTDANGFIFLNIHPDAFRNIIDRVTSGDAGGINVRQFDNGSPLIELEPGIDETLQIFDHTGIQNITLTVDHYINIRREDSGGNTIIADDSTFYIRILKGSDISLGGFDLRIVDGYVNPGNPGNIIYTFNQDSLDIVENDNIDFIVEVKYSLELDTFLTLVNGLPVGDAGGDLSGSYPNPTVNVDGTTIESVGNQLQVADDGIDTAQINNSAVTTDKINNSAVDANKIANNAVTEDKINGSAVSTAKIANNAVTFQKLQDISTATIIGRASGGSGDAEQLSASQVRTLLNVANGANNYSHPNHTGHVTSSGDGATTIANDVITASMLTDSAAGAGYGTNCDALNYSGAFFMAAGSTGHPNFLGSPLLGTDTISFMLIVARNGSNVYQWAVGYEDQAGGSNGGGVTFRTSTNGGSTWGGWALA